MRTRSALPWYRHPWPWILMAGPILVVIAGAITTWLAIGTSDGLIADDYYKQGLAVNQRIERDRLAAELGLSGQLMLADDGRRLRLILGGQSPFKPPPTVLLTLAHPTRTGFDQRVELGLRDDGAYGGSLAKPVSGRWHVAVQDPGGNWRLTAEWKIVDASALALSPGSQGNRPNHP